MHLMIKVDIGCKVPLFSLTTEPINLIYEFHYGFNDRQLVEYPYIMTSLFIWKMNALKDLGFS